MTDRKLFGIGITGATIAAICCFTPVLVVLFAALGLSAWLLWIDYVLWPVLAISLVIAGLAAARLLRKRANASTARDMPS